MLNMAEILDALLSKDLILSGMSIAGLIIVWKRYAKFTDETKLELMKVRDEIKKYMNEDRKASQDALNHNTEVLHDFNETNKRTNYILQCFMDRMAKFEQSNIYQEYLKKERV